MLLWCGAWEGFAEGVDDHLRSLIVGLDDCKAESEELGASEGEASSPSVGPNNTSELDGTTVGTRLVGTVGDNDGNSLLVNHMLGSLLGFVGSLLGLELGISLFTFDGIVDGTELGFLEVCIVGLRLNPILGT
jgi:hypothetical protein